MSQEVSRRVTVTMTVDVSAVLPDELPELAATKSAEALALMLVDRDRIREFSRGILRFQRVEGFGGRFDVRPSEVAIVETRVSSEPR